MANIVWLLTIEHRHGIDHWVCGSEAVANDRLDGYVKYWWDQENGSAPPDDRDERIEQYFNASDEHYSIEEHEIDGGGL